MKTKTNKNSNITINNLFFARLQLSHLVHKISWH